MLPRHVNEIIWNSPENNLTANAQVTILYNEFKNHILTVTATCPFFKKIIFLQYIYFLPHVAGANTNKLVELLPPQIC